MKEEMLQEALADQADASLPAMIMDQARQCP
jgi:hypothetical protein